MRGDRRDRGSGSFHTVDITFEVFSQALAVVRLNIVEDTRCLRMCDDDVKRAPFGLVRLHQSLVVVDGSSNPKSSYETQASSGPHWIRLVFSSPLG